MDSFQRILMTADPKLANSYLVMAREAGVKDNEAFHLILNESAPSPHSEAAYTQYAKSGLNPEEYLPAQVRYLTVRKLENGKDGTIFDDVGRYRYAMTPALIEENLEKFESDNKRFKNAFNRSSGVSKEIRNEASVNIIQTLLTGENQSYWFDALSSIDITFGLANRLAPRDAFGFFSDEVLAANSRYAGAGQIQGTTNSSIAEQKQQIKIQPLAVFTRALKLAPEIRGSMNPYIEAVLASGGRQMISAQAATNNVVESEIYQTIVDETGESVNNNLFSSILAGVTTPADLTGANIFEWMQNFGIFLKLFAENGGNARAKDLVVPVEDYWVLVSTLSAAFAAGAASNFGYAITPIQYLQDTLGMNVVPSNSLGDAAGEIKTWLISSEALKEPNAKPTYGMMHVDEGSLYYGFSGLNFTVPQTAPVHAKRYTEVAYYRRNAWATLTWT